jgi:hypothetical protein
MTELRRANAFSERSEHHLLDLIQAHDVISPIIQFGRPRALMRCHLLRLLQIPGQHHEMPVHHTLEEYLDAYIDAPGICQDKKGPLFRASNRINGHPLEGRTRSGGCLHMIRRRTRQAGIETKIGCRTFRATGITIYLTNGGDLEKAQQMAAHESSRPTKLLALRNSVIIHPRWPHRCEPRAAPAVLSPDWILPDWILPSRRTPSTVATPELRPPAEPDSTAPIPPTISAATHTRPSNHDTPGTAPLIAPHGECLLSELPERLQPATR